MLSIAEASIGKHVKFKGSSGWKVVKSDQNKKIVRISNSRDFKDLRYVNGKWIELKGVEIEFSFDEVDLIYESLEVQLSKVEKKLKHFKGSPILMDDLRYTRDVLSGVIEKFQKKLEIKR